MASTADAQHRAVKILLHLSCHKNGIGGSLTFHESKLHVVNHNLLPNSVLKSLFYNFHSMAFSAFGLQCFDAIGWVAGRASGL